MALVLGFMRDDWRVWAGSRALCFQGLKGPPRGSGQVQGLSLACEPGELRVADQGKVVPCGQTRGTGKPARARPRVAQQEMTRVCPCGGEVWS